MEWNCMFVNYLYHLDKNDYQLLLSSVLEQPLISDLQYDNNSTNKKNTVAMEFKILRNEFLKMQYGVNS